ncbi:MAG TPA: hypothetical protein VGM17_02485 [Rhizomicrobium sp.]|jgi:hypothetical protein
MVAYSFKRQFIEPIRSGSKRQTIRAERKRHARIGETLQLYTGMRTKQCMLIGTAVCSGVDPIEIDFVGDEIAIGARPPFCGAAALDRFARADGFADWKVMTGFWTEVHQAPARWCGVLIRWESLTVAPWQCVAEATKR